MSDTQSNTAELSTLSDIERLIRAGSDKQLEEARSLLRNWLIEKAGASRAGRTIADAVALIEPNPHAGARPAKVLLRCLAVPGLVPPANPTNQLARHFVALCEGALPDISEFLGLGGIKQNYEKFSILSSAHHRICDLLSPLRAEYIGLESLISSHKAVISALNHSIVRSYCEPFRIGEVRRIIEVISQQLQRAVALEATLSNDIGDCRRILSDGRALIAEAPTVLNIDFLLPFLASAEAALDLFLKSIESRLATAIVIGGAGSELQKRYPLHEAGRSLQILIPLRNSGPGTATNLRATVTGDSDQIKFSPNSIFVGNVRVGDFSIGFDALVVSP